jgi:type I restriction enzyme S subunit
MSFEFFATTLGDFLTFSNGKSSPVRCDNGKIVVFGANGEIGRCNETNSQSNSIIVGRVGSYCGAVHFSKSPCWITDNAIKAVVKNGNDPFFAYCLLKQLNLNNWRSGSGQPLINQSTLNSILVTIPPPREQKAIGYLASTIDYRISLLRETNTTLEAIAQTLFKSWFVDFDPVKAKAEGRLPEGMDEATAALFPSEFEVSALGLIPKGWKVGALSELCKIASGKRPINRSDNEMQDASIPLYGGAGIMGFTSESLFHEPKILTGRVGTLGKVHLVYPPFWASDNVLVLSPIESRNFLFCFHWVSEVDVYALNRGSTQPLLTQKDLGNQQRTLPTDNVLDVFSEIVDTIYEKIRLNVKQSQTLTTLRDTLLPRLISGQLRLNQAQEIMDEVGA